MHKLFPHRKVYTLENGRSFQINGYGTVFCISDIIEDPHLPGYMDITDAITSPTYEEVIEVMKLVNEEC